MLRPLLSRFNCKSGTLKHRILVSLGIIPAEVCRIRKHGSRNRRCLSTYYDSQSGLHLPVHNETNISLFLDVREGHQQSENKNEDRKNPFVPHQLNKDRVEAEEVSDKLKELAQQGIHGVILPAIKFPRDIRNIHTLSVIAPPGFVFLSVCNNQSETNESKNVDNGLLRAKELSSSDTNFSKVLRYQSTEDFQKKIRHSVDKGLHTTLEVTDDIYAGEGDDMDPITIANNIGAMIDTTGGCEYIWISSERQEEKNKIKGDMMVEVCEELGYLDVAGATIKSRLLVDFFNEDMLEDIMFAGVNKYVIQYESEAEMVETIAKEQGKELLRP